MADGSRAPCPHQVWTGAMDMALIAAKRRGESLSQIAMALGVTRSAVSGRVHRLRCTGRLEGPATVAVPGAVQDGEAAPAPAEPRRSIAAADRVGQSPSARVWVQHLDAIGNPPGFPPAVDLALVEGLARGASLAAVAADLGLDVRAARARFFALLPVTGIEAQTLLLGALRARVAGMTA